MEVNKFDLWIMLLSTIRYSMGRQTYMPSLCRDLILSYHSILNIDELEQIVREITRELQLYTDLGKTLGSKYDHETWQQTVKTVERLLEERKT